MQDSQKFWVRDMVERNRDLEKLIARMNNDMIKVVAGVRRCGLEMLD